MNHILAITIQYIEHKPILNATFIEIAVLAMYAILPSIVGVI
jgi:hypothetical protein